MRAPLGLVFMTSYWTVARSSGTADTTVQEASFPPIPPLPSVCMTSPLLTSLSVHCQSHSLLRPEAKMKNMSYQTYLQVFECIQCNCVNLLLDSFMKLKHLANSQFSNTVLSTKIGKRLLNHRFNMNQTYHIQLSQNKCSVQNHFNKEPISVQATNTYLNVILYCAIFVCFSVLLLVIHIHRTEISTEIFGKAFMTLSIEYSWKIKSYRQRKTLADFFNTIQIYHFIERTHFRYDNLLDK